MGGGSYSTNNRVNAAAAAAAAQRAAALASGPAYPVVREPVVSLPPKAVVAPKEEVVDIAASPFDINTFDFSNLDFSSFGGIDLDLSGLDMNALREAVNPTPAPTERVPTTASTSGLSVQDFGAQPTFGSPDEALANYGNVFNTLKGQEEQVNKVYNYNNFDPGDFGRTSVSLREGSRAAGTGLAEYVQQNKIPLSKVIDGERKYLTTGNAQANQELWPNAFQGGDLVATGPVGTYSTTFQKDKNLLVQVASDPILQVVGAFFPPLALATTAVKAVAGETLHGGDWLNLASAGLNKAGLTTPPATDATGNVLDEGVGLFGTSYDQTQNIMEAASAAGSDGNPAEILIKGFGVTDDVLDSIGLDEAAFDDSIVDYKGFVEGVEQAASQVAGGDSIEDAIKGGVLDYVVESAGDIDLGVVTDAVEAVGSFLDDNIFQPILDTVGDIDLGEFEDTVRDLGREFDDEVLQEIKGGIEEFAPQVEDFVKTVGGATVAAVETAGGITRDVIETVGGEVLDALKPIGTQLEDIAKATGSTVEDVLKGVAGVGEDILSGVGDVGQEVIDALGPLGTQLEDIAKATGSTVEDVIKGVVDVVSPIGAGIEDAIKATGSQLEDFIRPIGSAVEDIAKTTGKTVGDVLEGVADLTGDLGSSLEDAIKEGGSALEDFIRPIGSTIEDIAKATGSTVEDVLKGVASVGEDIIGEVGDVGQDVIDALKPLGSTLEDFAKATGSTLEDVLKDVGGLGEDILSGVAAVGSDVIDAVKASGLSTEGMLQSGFQGLAAQQAAQAADARRLAVATRTTDSLFSDFKGFETEIGGTPIELVELIQRNRR